MQTPPGPEGQITEHIMREWREKNPEADTRTYNATYARTLEIVRAKLAADRVTAAPPTPLTFGVNARGIIVTAPSLLDKLAHRV